MAIYRYSVQSYSSKVVIVAQYVLCGHRDRLSCSVTTAAASVIEQASSSSSRGGEDWLHFPTFGTAHHR